MILLVYPFFLLISVLIPRRSKLWVFGCHDGYVENTKYFFEYASALSKFDCYWLANDEKELASVGAAGNNVVLKNSFRGYWLSSRAAITFICTGYSDVNRALALSGKIVNFWHGTPIKKIYLDSKHDLQRFGTSQCATWITRMLLKFLNSRITMYYASNEFEKSLVSCAAGISLGRSKALGSPRYDEIRKNAAIDVFGDLRNRYKRFILYAPTWRENGLWTDSFTMSAKEQKDFLDKLRSLDAVLIVKPHPLTKIKEIQAFGLSSSDRIIYTQDLGIKDINVIYPHIDMLVTDISSSMFDFLIFNKPVVLFMPDVVEYLSGERGIYDYFQDTLRSYCLHSWSDIIKRLDQKEQEIPFLNELAAEVTSYTGVCQSIHSDIEEQFYEGS